MKNFLTLKLWFALRPGALTPTGSKVFLVMLGLLLAGAIAFAVIKRKTAKSAYSRINSRLASFFSTNLIIGVFLFLFYYQGLVFLSMRVWFLVWLIAMIVWLVYIARHFRQIPELVEQKEREKEFKKYLPKNGK